MQCPPDAVEDAVDDLTVVAAELVQLQRLVMITGLASPAGTGLVDRSRRISRRARSSLEAPVLGRLVIAGSSSARAGDAGAVTPRKPAGPRQRHGVFARGLQLGLVSRRAQNVANTSAIDSLPLPIGRESAAPLHGLMARLPRPPFLRAAQPAGPSASPQDGSSAASRWRPPRPRGPCFRPGSPGPPRRVGQRREHAERHRHTVPGWHP